MKVILLVLAVALLCALPATRAIHISTADLSEVYSGPGGAPAPGWDTLVDPNQYSQHFSVVQFILSTSQNPEYYYTSVQELFAPPRVQVEAGVGIIDPVVYGDAADGYMFEDSSYFLELPELSIFFNCQMDGRATVSVTIDSSVIITEEGGNTSKNDTVTFYFAKECKSSGLRDGFSIGKEAGRYDDVVKHGAVQHRWALESEYIVDANPVTISADEHFTTFFLSISNPTYGNQYFYEPVVDVEDDDLVEVQVRGNAAMGGVVVGMPETLVLLYDCLATGDTEINVRLDLGFQGEIEFGFTKTCSMMGEEELGMPGLINVGTSRSDYAGVVTNSFTSPLWDSREPTVEVGSDQILTNFFVSTVSGKNQTLYKPVVTVNPANAFGVTLSGAIRDGGLVTGTPHHFVVNYLCDRVSEAKVTITLKMPHSRTVEFSYIKVCKPFKTHTDTTWTANQLMVAFIFGVAAVSAGGYLLYKKRRTGAGRPGQRARV